MDYPYGFDVVVEATGVESIVEDSINYVRRGGTLLVYGVYEDKARVSWPPSKIFSDEIRVSFARISPEFSGLTWTIRSSDRSHKLIASLAPSSTSRAEKSRPKAWYVEHHYFEPANCVEPRVSGHRRLQIGRLSGSAGQDEQQGSLEDCHPTLNAVNDKLLFIL